MLITTLHGQKPLGKMGAKAMIMLGTKGVNPVQMLLPEASSAHGLRLPTTVSQIAGSGTNMTTVALFVHGTTSHFLGR